MFIMASSKEQMLTGEVEEGRGEVYVIYSQLFSIIILD